MAMGRFESVVSAIGMMCLCAGYAQAQSQNSTSQDPQVLQKQAENPGELPIASRVVPPEDAQDSTQTNAGQASEQQPTHTPDPVWFYGAFLDAACLLDFNHPVNDLFRTRG